MNVLEVFYAFSYKGNKYVLEMDGEIGHGNKQYKNSKWIQDEECKLFSSCTYYVIKKEIYFITLNY